MQSLSPERRRLPKKRKPRRQEYEFSFATKLSALERDSYTCQRCLRHRKDLTPKYLEVHHQIPIWFAQKYLPELPAHYLRSVECALSLCLECHKAEHEEKSEDELWQIAISLLGINLTSRTSLTAFSSNMSDF